MKILVSVAGLVLITGMAYWLWPEPTITNYPSDGTEIVAFGDSLVAGVGSSGGGFVSQLATEIDRPIVNLGVSGDTTADGVERLDDVLERDAQVVLVLLGGNDAIRKIPLESTRQNLSTIITEIQGTGAVVVLLGVRSGLLADNYDDMYENLAKVHGTVYVPDILHGVFGRPNLMADPIHPNDAGYKKITERILPVLESVL